MWSGIWSVATTRIGISHWLTLSLLPKLLPRKLGPWFIWWSFFLLRFLSISINLRYDHACRVRINISWFGKYDAFFIFHNTVFLTYPEKLDTKESFCFLNWGAKTKFFLAVKVQNDFNMMHIQVFFQAPFYNR